MSTHAVGTPDTPFVLRVFAYLDIVVLALALPVFLLAGFPLAGWGTAAAAWLVQRAIRAALAKRAAASEDPRTLVGLTAASMIARGWLMALSIFGVGLAAGDDAGLSAAILVVALFTIYLSSQMILRPLEPGKPTV